ncbi:uncharacterized protein LOC144617029 [Panthera onca]
MRTKAFPVETKRFPSGHHDLILSPVGGLHTCPNLRHWPESPAPGSETSQSTASLPRDPGLRNSPHPHRPRLPPTRQGSWGTAGSAPSAAAGRYPTNRYARLVAPSVCVTRRRGAELLWAARGSHSHAAGALHAECGGWAPLPFTLPLRELARGGGAGSSGHRPLPPSAPTPVRPPRGRDRGTPIRPQVPRILAVTYTRAGRRCRPTPQSLADKREKPRKTDGAYPRGLRCQDHSMEKEKSLQQVMLGQLDIRM